MIGPVRYPRPLRSGSRIFVTAPSSGVARENWPRLDIVLDGLRARGFVVEEGQCLRAQQKSASATAQQRAAELMAAFLRPDVDAVIPPWGGELAIEILPLLDFEALARAEPKWFFGFSDLSTIMLPLRLLAGWASVHGPNLMELSPSQTDELTVHALAPLQTEAGGRVTQLASVMHRGSEIVLFSVDPNAAHILTEPTTWWALGGETEVRMKGRVLGGCLDTWMHLVGTPYGDVPAFVRAAGEEGCLLFLENCDLPANDVVRALCQLRYAGWFDGLQGLLLGRSNHAESPKETELDYEDAVAQSLAGLSCSVLMDVDFGHVPPQFTLVQGALGEVHWSTGARAVITQTLAP